MSPETLAWMWVGHVVGFTLWLGAMFGLSYILTAHAAADEAGRGAFGKLEKNTAMTADIGATLAIVFGLIMLLVPEGGTQILKAGGFFHIKLTLVALLIGTHGYLRVKVKKFSRGEVHAPPAWLFPVMALAALGIVIMIVVRPFASGN